MLVNRSSIITTFLCIKSNDFYNTNSFSLAVILEACSTFDLPPYYFVFLANDLLYPHLVPSGFSWCFNFVYINKRQGRKKEVLLFL